MCFYLVIIWLSLKTCQMHWSEHTVDTERNLWYFFKWLLTITILLRKQAGHFTHWSKKLIYLLIANSGSTFFFLKLGLVSYIFRNLAAFQIRMHQQKIPNSIVDSEVTLVSQKHTKMCRTKISSKFCQKSKNEVLKFLS